MPNTINGSTADCAAKVVDLAPAAGGRGGGGGKDDSQGLDAILSLLAERIAALVAPKLSGAQPALAKDPRLLDIDEAAERLNLSRSTLYKQTKAQAIPHVKIGSRVLFEPAALDAFIEAKRRSPERVRELARNLAQSTGKKK